MKTKRMKQLLYALCLGLCVCLTSAASAQSDTPSVMDRVHKVEDPELGDLIRIDDYSLPENAANRCRIRDGIVVP